jgi:protein-disulfide isomerase
VAYIAGGVVFRDNAKQELALAAQSNNEALVRAHAPVYGNPAARVTIVEFFDPACETCRVFHPIVKGIVNASFSQVRLVVRNAPLHKGSDKAVKILEAARQQGRYWEALEKTMAARPQ